jgi:hypothetical protein
MANNLFSKTQILYNSIRGYTSNKKYLVIESDDWGATRMPSRDVYDLLYSKGVDVASNPFNRLDALESTVDLEVLLDTLGIIEKKYSKTPKLTMNFIVANPDFEAIKNSNFYVYHYTNFTDSYKNDARSRQVLSSIKRGIESNFIKPQFHGREHVNVPSWLTLLREGQTAVRLAFESETYALSLNDDMKNSSLWKALNRTSDFQSDQFRINYIREGLAIFEEVFGFTSDTFIAPAAVWDSFIEGYLKACGVSYLQSFIVQKESTDNESIHRNIYHFTGQKNRLGMTYLVRNCFFEPSTNQSHDWVKSCLNQVGRAFFLKKPAIISTHRINFVGGIQEENRTTSVAKFKKLLFEILNRWPEVEFISSDELGKLIRYNNKILS